MEGGAGCRAQSGDVARVGWDLRLKENHLWHEI
jgi:hypothetical protein